METFWQLSGENALFEQELLKAKKPIPGKITNPGRGECIKSHLAFFLKRFFYFFLV
jgi:hypothetical protein